MEICQASEKSKTATKTPGKIPFELMRKHESVYVSNLVNLGSLRSVVSHACRKYSKEFKVFSHPEHNCYEVSCVENIRPLTETVGLRIVESSDMAKAKFGTDLGGSKRYPFDELSEGFSFAVPFAEGNEPSMRVQCSTWGKRLGKKIILLRHENIKMFEIACIPVKPIEFLPNSDEAKAKANAVQTEVMPSAYEAPVAPEAAKPMFFTEPEMEGLYNEG